MSLPYTSHYNNFKRVINYLGIVYINTLLTIVSYLKKIKKKLKNVNPRFGFFKFTLYNNIYYLIPVCWSGWSIWVIFYRSNQKSGHDVNRTYHVTLQYIMYHVLERFDEKIFHRITGWIHYISYAYTFNRYIRFVSIYWLLNRTHESNVRAAFFRYITRVYYLCVSNYIIENAIFLLPRLYVKYYYILRLSARSLFYLFLFFYYFIVYT